MTPNSSGLLITFEGIDGAGKSTHIPYLAEVFRQQGRAVVLTREPGGTPLAETLRELVLHQRMDALTESLLIFAARRDHIQTVIAPALARGEVVLCDRFTDATFAYQGAGHGFDTEVLTQLEHWAQYQQELGKDSLGHVLQPDLTIWFDLDPQLAAQRLQGVRLPDKFEAQPVAFFRRVADGYAQRQAQAGERFARVDAAQSPEQVWLAVQAICQARGWLV